MVLEFHILLIINIQKKSSKISLFLISILFFISRTLTDARIDTTFNAKIKLLGLNCVSYKSIKPKNPVKVIKYIIKKAVGFIKAREAITNTNIDNIGTNTYSILIQIK